MLSLLRETDRTKKILFFYWLIVPVLFGSYLIVMSSVQQIPIMALVSTIPSLAISLIVALLQFFQAFGLYLLNDVAASRKSLLGNYLIFSMVQQLFTLNFIGLLLSGLCFWYLPSKKEQEGALSSIKIPLYLLMSFIGVVTLLIVCIRFSL
ncbi:hypothetical protein [Enterococcus rivorum]|uniref:hypothetical protein n=1 Tax=Enterococcus rivorum TaxID=762845 RepID=UPI0009FC6B1E|nr:hypothetical protein [Enterococcus rivorum]MBP2099302.1 hypothetical protein [Enterococcus rivorum]